MQGQPNIILVQIPTASGAVVPVIFVVAASQTTKSKPVDAQELLDSVLTRKGNVDQPTAAKFVNNGLYGGFGPDFSFTNLPLETRLNLYQSYVQNAEVTANHQQMLDGLHQTLGFDAYLAEYGKRQDQVLEAAYRDKNKIEQTWRAEGRSSTFGNTLNRFVRSPQSFSADDKISLLQFVENLAAKADGRAPRKVVGYHDDNKNAQGYHNSEGIGINTNSDSFEKNPIRLLVTVKHEGWGHDGQDSRAEKVAAGQIKPTSLTGSPASLDKQSLDYVIGRISYAQMKSGPGGYIQPENLLGDHGAYLRNWIEGDARRAGEKGVQILLATYGLISPSGSFGSYRPQVANNNRLPTPNVA